MKTILPFNLSSLLGNIKSLKHEVINSIEVVKSFQEKNKKKAAFPNAALFSLIY
jgi:hypothetical protein